MRRIYAHVFVVSLIGVLLGASSPGIASAGTTAINPLPANCDLSGDLSNYSIATLNSCGLDAWPQTSTTALPGGGEAVSYDEGQYGTVTFFVPPTGFEPLDASAAQLAEYGFPARPAAGSPDFATWEQEMSVWSGAAAPPALDVSDPALDNPVLALADSATYNWAGWEATGSNGTYTTAEAEYVQPTMESGRCSSGTPTSGFWTGIGGTNSSSALGQIGTSFGLPDVDNGAQGAAFWEVVPSGGGGSGPHWITSFVPGGGQTVSVQVNWQNDGYGFFFENVSNGRTTSFAETGGSNESYSGNSAEMIAEYPYPYFEYDDTSYGLSNFGTFSVLNAGGNGYALNTLSPTSLNAVGYVTGDDLMDPSGIGSGGAFSVTLHNCY